MAAGLKSLVLLAFFGSVGMTLLVVGCATHENWWPFFVTIFYILAPVPMLISRRYSSSGMGPSNACQELAIFITMGIVISAFGLPIVLHRAPTATVGKELLPYQRCSMLLEEMSLCSRPLLDFSLRLAMKMLSMRCDRGLSKYHFVNL